MSMESLRFILKQETPPLRANPLPNQNNPRPCGAEGLGVLK
jgi:hypothetical protein